MHLSKVSAKLIDWNDRYEDLLNSLNIGFMLFSPDYFCHDVNDAFLQMVGANREDYQMLDLQNLFSPEEFTQLYNIVEPLELGLKKQKTTVKEKYYQFEWFWYHHQTHKKIPMLFTGSVIMGKDGLHERTLITCMDLSRQKQTQEELEKEKNKLETILFGIGDCVTIFDPDGRLLLTNSRGTTIRGNRQTPFLELVNNHKKELTLYINGEQCRYTGKIEAVKDNQGDIYAFAEILKDTTNQAKLERQDFMLRRMKQQIQRMELETGMIGVSRAMRNVFDLILRCAGVDSTILILGETGVGKELVAKAIHEKSARSKYPFIAINCGALPETLLESELFGHTKGSFTGATQDNKGLFREAEGGTLFLDEIGDLTPSLQVKLLRVLQEREVRPIGGKRNYPIDVKVISATHRDLNKLISRDDYRQDLYYRLAVIPITVPPLKKRKDDILPLVDHFLQKISKKNKTPLKSINHATQEALTNYPWPGNVRELGNCIEHAFVMSKDHIITLDDLPHLVAHYKAKGLPPTRLAEARPGSDQAQEDTLDSTPNISFGQNRLKPWEEDEKKVIEQILITHKGNRTKTAKNIGICRATLWRKIKHYDIIL